MDAEQIKIQEFAKQLARLSAESRCEDVVIMDLRGLTSVADYFVVCSGTSDRQIRSAADELQQYGKTIGERAYSATGADTATWIVVDFIHIVVHIFTPECRAYYDLELLWGDAPRVEWTSDDATAQATEVAENGHDDTA